MVVLHADGASPAQLQRGVHAALVYFSLHGLDAGDVWRARIKIEDEDIGVPGIQLTAHEEKIWHHWHEAEVENGLLWQRECTAARMPRLAYTRLGQGCLNGRQRSDSRSDR